MEVIYRIADSMKAVTDGLIESGQFQFMTLDAIIDPYIIEIDNIKQGLRRILSDNKDNTIFLSDIVIKTFGNPSTLVGINDLANKIRSLLPNPQQFKDIIDAHINGSRSADIQRLTTLLPALYQILKLLKERYLVGYQNNYDVYQVEYNINETMRFIRSMLTILVEADLFEPGMITINKTTSDANPYDLIVIDQGTPLIENNTALRSNFVRSRDYENGTASKRFRG